RTGLQAVSYYIDMMFGPEITPEAPGAPVLSVPADLAINVNEYAAFSWTAPIAGGVPAGYRLFVGTNNPPTTLIADQTALTYTFASPLAYNTTYYWTVEAYNSAGTGPQAVVRSFTTRANPIVSTFPWTVDFGTTGASFPPVNWNKHSGVLANPTVLGTPGTGSWAQRNWRNVTVTPVDFAAVINIYSSLNGWLISPPIAVPGNDYELKFDLALTDYYNSNSIFTDPNGPSGIDDVFAVLIGDGTSWTPANVVRQWDNAGSAYVYNNISHLGETVTLPLGSAGTKYIAFYGISTLSNADNDLFVDNVLLRQIPAAPIFVITPTAWDFSQTVINTVKTKQFTISNNGGGTLDISSIGIAGNYYTLISNPAPVSLMGGQSASFTVQYAPTAVGSHIGTVTITDNRAVTNVALSA
ncbi:MAG: choice-of-anchor D domain-containing protein, partial [Actinomycetota bacterium]|nr:choice-of-anchor D domain-containing protein [Actinomycetota bacterium]